jgi:Fe-S-cluster containining protein
MSSGGVFALSIHADYRCRHSGVCCSVEWDVPIELPVYRTLKEAVDAGRLQVQASARHLHPFVVDSELPDGAAAVFERTERDGCVFLDRGTKLCIVHRDLGEAALPATCRYFPRLAVRDNRGTFITLSHFCPTAASMLFREDCPLAIVAMPPAFPPGDYDGLVVTDNDLPPLLCPTMLMDPPAYTAWEHHMIGRCAMNDCSPETVVATLERDARVLRAWKPAGQSLTDAVAGLPGGLVTSDAVKTLDASLILYGQVMQAIPDDLRPVPDEGGLDAAFVQGVGSRWAGFYAPLNRYLATKAFASWTAYQGRGILTIVRGLEAALAIVRVECARLCRDSRRELDGDVLRDGFRNADFILNHLAVGEDLAAAWSSAEA